MLVHFWNRDYWMRLHLQSTELKKMNAETIVDAIYNVFAELNINVKNLVSIQIDISNVAV